MEKASYLGGLITGEGCFCLAVRKRRGKIQITPIFSIFMTDRATIDLVAQMLTELNLPVYRQERPQAGGEGHCGIHISGLQRVKRYCETLNPYLTGKKAGSCAIVWEFIRSRQQKPKGAPYDDHEIALVRELRLHNGNTKGRKTPL